MILRAAAAALAAALLAAPARGVGRTPSLASRRGALGRVGGAAVAAAGAALGPPEASAKLIVPDDNNELQNRYVIVRTGETVAEAADMVLSNPVMKTNIDLNGLTPRGVQQVMDAVETLRTMPLADTWLYYNLHASAAESAELVIDGLQLERSRAVPEYSFFDARGMGRYENGPLDARRAVWAQDALSRYNRPPPTNDGTPPESVEDVFVRVRQLLAVTETQYSGADVVLLIPDDDVASILQAGVLGVPLERHTELHMGHGDIRVVTGSSITKVKPVRQRAAPEGAPRQPQPQEGLQGGGEG